MGAGLDTATASSRSSPTGKPFTIYSHFTIYGQ